MCKQKVDNLSHDFKSLSDQFDGLLKFFMNIVSDRISNLEKDIAALKEKK